MRTQTLFALAALTLAAVPARAEKVPADFRTAFERTFGTGRTYGVVMREGIPTTSIYGVEGNQTAAHFSIDIVDGNWKVSQGLLDTDQTAADFLTRGEVVELKAISWKDNRVDLRFESTEAHKVTRGALFLKDTKREPVATNFKFFFPFPITGAGDVPKAIRYIDDWVKPFPSEQQARNFTRGAARADGGSGTRPSAERPAAKKTTTQEIKAGMTAVEVIDVLGRPTKETTFGNKQKWAYPDLTVLFENGRVTEVKF
jgi:hypothetical protein